MKNITLIAGTRPEIIKMLPVYLELKKRPGIEPRLVLTGQHRELAQDVLRLFRITPDADMQVMQPDQTLEALTSRLSQKLSEYLLENRPDILLVQGDTSSAMVAAMLGFYGRVPVGHVEAGLRTHNMQNPFPEEFNRRVLTLAARWHFAPTQQAVANLRREEVTEGVHMVGNTVIDAALLMAERETEATRALAARFPFLQNPERGSVLITAHRRENFGAGMRSIAQAIQQLAEQWPNLSFLFPLHPNPNVKPVMQEALSAIPNVHLADPLGYDEMIYVMKRAKMVLTDSGGIQEEAPAFDVPVLVLREETERPEGVEAGCSVVVGTSPQRISENFARILNDPAVYQRMASAPNPYGDGRASQRIVDILSV